MNLRELTASLKRCPDTNRGFSPSLFDDITTKRTKVNEENQNLDCLFYLVHLFDRGTQPLGNGVTIVNRSGVVLLGLDEASANNLGGWKVVTINDRVESGAPSFCRSGAGHPVWGRQWCLDKGFGLGTPSNVRWASTNLSDVVFTQPTTTQLMTAAVLRQVIGPTAFDRLAAHAITLGLVDPLTATWLGQPTGGPRVLYVQSGTYPVAELVDVNRDNRPETMLVALRPW